MVSTFNIVWIEVCKSTACTPLSSLIVSMGILSSMWLQVTRDTTYYSIQLSSSCRGWAGLAGLDWAGSHFKENTHEQFNDRWAHTARTVHTAAAANPFKEKYKPRVVADRSWGSNSSSSSGGRCGAVVSRCGGALLLLQNCPGLAPIILFITALCNFVHFSDHIYIRRVSTNLEVSKAESSYHTVIVTILRIGL